MLGATSRRSLACLTSGLLLVAALPDAAGQPLPPSAPAPASAAAPMGAPASTPAVPQWKLEQEREILFREGQKLVQDGRWKEALDKFRAVNKIRSHPRVLLWMGFPEEQLGELLAARTLYLQAKEGAHQQKLKQEEQDADAALTALAQKIPHLVIQVPKGSKPEIYLDSARVTLEGEQVDVDPDKHKLSIVWPDRPTYSAEVEIKVGETKTIDGGVVKGNLQFLSVPAEAKRGAGIEATGGPAGPAAASGAAKSGASSGATGAGGPGSAVPTGLRTGIIIGGSAGAGVALITGIALTAAANGKASENKEKAAQAAKVTGVGGCPLPPPTTGICAETAAAFKARASLSNGAVWSFIAAGALGAGTVIYAFTTKNAPKAAVRAAPVVTANGGGFTVDGAW